MGHQRRAGLRADALDHVEHARRQPGLVRPGPASSEHDSGDHSAGLSTTVQPAASAGAVFQVDSMNGAFHGVITAAGPAGMRWTRFQVPTECQSRSS